VNLCCSEIIPYNIGAYLFWLKYTKIVWRLGSARNRCGSS